MAHRSFKLVFHYFLSSLVTQNFYFLYCKHKIVAVGKGKELKGQKKKKANADVDKERQSLVRAQKAKCSTKCVGDLVVRRINKTSDLSIFLLLWHK